MQCREAVAEDRGSEEDAGLSAVLREACTSALYASAMLACQPNVPCLDGVIPLNVTEHPTAEWAAGTT